MLNKRNHDRASSYFDRTLLPSPKAFYLSEFPKLNRLNGSGWVRVICPFHPDRHPSLSLNLRSGGFYCFACGAKGGDIIDFLRLRYGLSFNTAVSQLGAHRTNSTTEHSRALQHRGERIRQQKVADQIDTESKRLRFSTVKELRHLERLQGRAKRRLSELQRGSSERYKGESELVWWILQDILPRIRRAVAAHNLLSFASTADREAFVRYPEQRESMVDKVLDLSYVRDDQGRYVAVEL